MVVVVLGVEVGCHDADVRAGDCQGSDDDAPQQVGVEISHDGALPLLTEAQPDRNRLGDSVAQCSLHLELVSAQFAAAPVALLEPLLQARQVNCPHSSLQTHSPIVYNCK